YHRTLPPVRRKWSSLIINDRNANRSRTSERCLRNAHPGQDDRLEQLAFHDFVSINFLLCGQSIAPEKYSRYIDCICDFIFIHYVGKGKFVRGTQTLER